MQENWKECSEMWQKVSKGMEEKINIKYTQEKILKGKHC